MEESIGEAVVQELAPEKSEIHSEEDMPGLMPEAGHTHIHPEHESGNRWLDVIVAVSVIFISAVSLVVSINHGRTMEKMVEQNQKMVDQNQKLVVANTLPLLAVDVENQMDLKKIAYVRLSVKNSGVGPAVIDRFEIRYKGISYQSPFGSKGLLNALFAGAPQPKFIADSSVSGSILPARDAIRVIEIPITTPQTLQLLHVAEPEIIMKACYCSVLEECWETNFDHKRPQPVKECKVEPGEKLW
jgi:hypothetical protein